MENNLDIVLSDLCKREELAGCYDCEVCGIHVYNLVRFIIRNYYLSGKGLDFVEDVPKPDYWIISKSFISSAFQLSKLLLLNKKYDVMFYPFFRLDNVDGLYMDKFTDPVIDSCGLKGSFIIFERGRGSIHPKPRMHKEKVVYTNVIDICSEIYARLMYKRYLKRHKREFDSLFKAIGDAYGTLNYSPRYIINRIIKCICFINLYEKLFGKLQIKKIFAPSRSNLISLTYAAKRNGITVYEFQHGITYGETALYSGYRDPDFTPDYFLAYGDTPPRDVYGIDEEKMINIGWAFQDYLKKLSSGQKKYEKGVLVISNPCTTDKVLKATFLLADAFKEIQFVVRPHPVEVITQDHIKAIAKHENVSLQDWHINVALAMQSFDCIIGESSTVLYEALNDGKKVARFCFEGFTPEYLTPEDEECFWKVNDMESFKAFMDGKVEDKKSMKIYSKFNKELFLKLYNA